ncbi:hypothetical protein WJX84_007407 [Apatococcus fuscideae]|uniref:Amine oxidase domain-containing protein n=1 Tax=Apatococcus fuscideae TaxID=2026836 RepID=A0AAW1T1X3_9CHLO
MPRPVSARKVAIIGAGFAGLGAAKLLKSEARHASLDVTLLESSQRVGGRACTLQLPDAGRVELGATWLHGLKGNPMYELALQYGLMNGSERKQASSNWGSSFYVREGQAQPLSASEIAASQRSSKMLLTGRWRTALAAAKQNPRLTVGGHLQTEQWAQGYLAYSGLLPGPYVACGTLRLPGKDSPAASP